MPSSNTLEAVVPSDGIGCVPASQQAAPETLASLLEQHGSDPGADSRVRLQATPLAMIVGDLHAGLGIGLALAALMMVTLPSPRMLAYAIVFSFATAAAVLRLPRPRTGQGLADLAVAIVVAGLVASSARVNQLAPDVEPAIMALGWFLLIGLLAICLGLHRGRGFAARLARILAPAVPVAATLVVRG